MGKLWWVYLILVLGISASARAQQSNQSANIHRIEFKENSWIIQVVGQLSNLCQTTPRAYILQSKSNPNHLILDIVTMQNDAVCVLNQTAMNFQSLGRRYSTTFDLKALVNSSQLDIKEFENYRLHTPHFPFEVSFNGHEVLGPKPESSSKGLTWMVQHR